MASENVVLNVVLTLQFIATYLYTAQRDMVFANEKSLSSYFSLHSENWCPLVQSLILQTEVQRYLLSIMGKIAP